MQRVIWKYEINIDETVLDLPRGYQIRKVMWSGYGPEIWISVFPNSDDRVNVEFKIIGTGHPEPDGWMYVDTVKEVPYEMDTNATKTPYYWHIFMKGSHV